MIYKLQLQDKRLKERVIGLAKITKRTESSIFREALERFLEDAEDVAVSRSRMHQKEWDLEDIIAGRDLEN